MFGNNVFYLINDSGYKLFRNNLQLLDTGLTTSTSDKILKFSLTNTVKDLVTIIYENSTTSGIKLYNLSSNFDSPSDIAGTFNAEMGGELRYYSN